MTELLCYIRACDVAEYTGQGWQCWQLQGLHGARRGAQMRTFLAVLRLP